MKLSPAAVIIAAGTSSNVFSPNVVLAGKTGKLAPKASKAKAKAKAVKAHPSLSYGSGSSSYSMSTGPPPPPPPGPGPSPQPPCPCWSQSELESITADNVDEEDSDCADESLKTLSYDDDGDDQVFQAGVDNKIFFVLQELDLKITSRVLCTAIALTSW